MSLYCVKGRKIIIGKRRVVRKKPVKSNQVDRTTVLCRDNWVQPSVFRLVEERDGGKLLNVVLFWEFLLFRTRRFQCTHGCDPLLWKGFEKNTWPFLSNGQEVIPLSVYLLLGRGIILWYISGFSYSILTSSWLTLVTTTMSKVTFFVQGVVICLMLGLKAFSLC